MRTSKSTQSAGRCSRCDKPIYLGVDGPLVLTSSGKFHWSCRVADIREQADRDQSEEADSRARRVANGRRLAAQRKGGQS